MAPAEPRPIPFKAKGKTPQFEEERRAGGDTLNSHIASSAHRINLYSSSKSRPETAARLTKLEENGIPIVPITQPAEIDFESDEECERNLAAQEGGIRRSEGECIEHGRRL
ncbi:sulfite oxidase [Colletotrichum orchidophilum]|uniref:Sulfite oxidase n=1 Tax=Colletotrichum orchidophilum TaxID=1209926 RepID=A0A1G4BLM9_9PEZI|nr:sulfite oxidase [Colletotrichum orchidophilum]OHF02369.1 sulfite oxidase [Colletotrichum orchidophilum]